MGTKGCCLAGERERCVGQMAQVLISLVCGGTAHYSPGVFQACAIFLACLKLLDLNMEESLVLFGFL